MRLPSGANRGCENSYKEEEGTSQSGRTREYCAGVPPVAATVYTCEVSLAHDEPSAFSGVPIKAIVSAVGLQSSPSLSTRNADVVPRTLTGADPSTPTRQISESV